MDDEIRSEQYSDLGNLLKEKIMIRLTSGEEEIIVKQLPAPKPLRNYSQVYQIRGKHFPCIHNAIPEISKREKMRKSANGQIISFRCMTINEANDAADVINTRLGKYGYKATSIHNKVAFETSPETSLVPLLRKYGFRILYCEHSNIEEIVTFAKEDESKQSVNIRTIIEAKEAEVKRILNKKILLPKKLSKLYSNVCLPDIDQYDTKFLAFLIDQKPTVQQLSTYVALYHMAEIGIPFPYVDPRSLIRIIQSHTGMSHNTLQRYLYDDEFPLQKRLGTIYTFSEIELNLSLYSSDVRGDEQFVSAFDYLTKIAENKTPKMNLPATKIDRRSVQINKSKLIESVSKSTSHDVKPPEQDYTITPKEDGFDINIKEINKISTESTFTYEDKTFRIRKDKTSSKIMLELIGE